MSLIKKNRFSCITRLKIHHQLEHHTITISKKRLGHVTSPESKMAERDVSISHGTDFVFLSISTLS